MAPGKKTGDELAAEKASALPEVRKPVDNVVKGPSPAVAKAAPPKAKNLHIIEGLLDVDKPGKTAKKKRGWYQKMKFRHAAIIVSFFLLVAIPVTMTGLYMAFVARDQYHSASSFSVRSIDAARGSDILGMFTQASGSSTVSDSFVLLDFISSERMIRLLEQNFDLEKIYAPAGGDFLYGLKGGLPIETKVEYWKNMVSVAFDHSSGIIDLEVKAFDPESAQAIATFVIKQSEKLINDLSLTSRNEVLKAARDEVQVAEQRLAAARNAVRGFRDVSQEADPVEGARLATQMIAGLEQQVIELNTDLTTALSQMSGDSPRIRVMRSRIASIEKQISQEKQRFGSGSAQKSDRTASMSDVAGRIQQYEALQTEREFAERAYTAALAGLEKARLDADGKQRYLAVFLMPSLSELAQYPGRFANTMLMFLACMFVWGVGVMAFYNIRDRN